MRYALFLILFTSIAFAGLPVVHAEDADQRLRGQEAYTLGLAATQAGQLDKAADHFREALKLDPTHRLAPFEWEKLIRAPGRKLSKVMEEYDELLGLAPGRAWLLNNYGYLLRSTAEANGASETSKEDAKEALQFIMKRCVEVYEAAAKAAPEDTQIVSDTGLVLEFYPVVRDDAKALTYSERALDQTNGLYRDAYNGLVRVCERTRDWETLKKRSAHLVEQIKSGASAVSSKDDGTMRDVGEEGNALLLAHAERALETATLFLSGAAKERPVPAPVLRVADVPMPVPMPFRIDRPSEKRGRKTVKLKYEVKRPIEFRVRRAVQEAVNRRSSDQSEDTMTLRLERDRKDKSLVRIFSQGDPAVPEGYLTARLDKYGALDAASITANDVPTPRIQPCVAAALLRCVVAVPDRKVKEGETWEVDMVPFCIRDIGRPVPDGVVSGKSWQTVVGFEKVDGKRCAKIQTVYNAVIKSKHLRYRDHHAPAEGFVFVKGMCTVIHGTDGIPRRISWRERQHIDLSNAKVITGPGQSGLQIDYLVEYEIEAGKAPRS